jgi:hypothetical protein
MSIFAPDMVQGVKNSPAKPALSAVFFVLPGFFAFSGGKDFV